ncbi:MAG: uroporphyrinogen-III synthase [Burkholderiales bacterium]|nr:uroporphyrinogen-III synthase [Burkholderiales bacterium]
MSQLKLGLTLPVLGLPLLEIVPYRSVELAQAIERSLRHADLLTFASPNAFLTCDQLLAQFGYAWPIGLNVAVIGGGSEQTIYGSRLVPKTLIKPANPDRWDSEGLWETLQAFNESWQGQQVVMIHGDGGRALLAQRLSEAGALVDEFSVYQRQGLPESDPSWRAMQLLYDEQFCQLDQAPIWILSSSQACQFLGEGIGRLGISETWLDASLALVTHYRIGQAARAIGFSRIEELTPGDESIAKYVAKIVQRAL